MRIVGLGGGVIGRFVGRLARIFAVGGIVDARLLAVIGGQRVVLGGAVGGIVAGRTFEKVPVRMLKLIFGIFLIYGAARYLV